MLPLIRTTVNLCLIAAMAIQPMVFAAARGACDAGFASGACCQAQWVCTQCKCCDVKSDGELCGCCRVAEVDAGSCCASDSAEPQVGKGSDVVSTPTPRAGESLIKEAVVVSSCKCGMRSEPVAPLPQRTAVPQLRSLVVIAYLDHVASNVGLSVQPTPVSSRLPLGDLSPHFSQRFLCIWRI